MPEKILEVRNLKTYFYMKNGTVKAVDGISYHVNKGESLAIVGESGSGKSVGVSSVMRLIQPPGKIIAGNAVFQGRDLLKTKKDEIRRIRGNNISMIFQDPMSSLNPTMKIGEQIVEPLLWHNKCDRREAELTATKLLDEVGISPPEERLKQYPFELSGGMRQRVMIAMALICRPNLLIADEPTTSLDVTVQAQILSLIRDMQKKLDMSVIIITHDLAVASMFSDKVIVMYAGRIMEKALMSEFITNPLHPYSKGLLKSTPVIGDKRKQLDTIPGQPPDLRNLPVGCPFAERCSGVMEKCLTQNPPVVDVTDTHNLSCWIYSDEEVGKVG